MSTPADRIASHVGLVPYLSLGVFRGKVPSLPNVFFAIRAPFIDCALYAYDVENPKDRSQRIRVHRHGGEFGYYKLMPTGNFEFQSVEEKDIRIFVNERDNPVMYTEYLEQEKIRNAERDAERAERKAREARAEAVRALAYAEALERKARAAREFAREFAR